MKTKILGTNFNVKLSNDISEYGQGNFAKQRILIADWIEDDEKKTTFIHEVIEMINIKCDLGLSHQTISTLDTSISQVISDNPHIFKMTFNVNPVDEFIQENLK